MLVFACVPIATTDLVVHTELSGLAFLFLLRSERRGRTSGRSLTVSSLPLLVALGLRLLLGFRGPSRRTVLGCTSVAVITLLLLIVSGNVLFPILVSFRCLFFLISFAVLGRRGTVSLIVLLGTLIVLTVFFSVLIDVEVVLTIRLCSIRERGTFTLPFTFPATFGSSLFRIRSTIPSSGLRTALERFPSW